MLDPWFTENLCCPRDHGTLRESDSKLECESGHAYPVVEGIPNMLVMEAEDTHPIVKATLEARNSEGGRDGYHIAECVTDPATQRRIAEAFESYDPTSDMVDPVVRHVVAATNGQLYKSLVGKLDTYPIPEFRLPAASGKTLLDVGCNWGRWCIAAARKGYRPIGLDPSLGAILAARRVAKQLGVSARFVVGDAQFLPFTADFFDVVFSYSVIQHFGKDVACKALREIRRVLRPGGKSLVQMPNMFGIRSIQNQIRRSFCEPSGFDVRYWTPRELLRTFTELVGETTLSVDGYFGLGIQVADVHMLPVHYKIVVYSSELLRRASQLLPGLRYVADSLYLTSKKRG